jgi:chitinase
MVYSSPLRNSIRRWSNTVGAVLFLIMLMTFSTTLTLAQVNTGGTATTSNHQKQVIGYITNWDAWKAAAAGVPAQGALTHLNIDYAKYTILNFSFFGVAKDGSLHSGDLRNKNIYQPGAVQEPGPILHPDLYSSWDWYILFGELELIQYISQEVQTRATAQGFQCTVGGSTWSFPSLGIMNQTLPMPLRKVGGAPGLLDLAHQKGVKVMASIGGWSMCKHFPEMAADPVKRQKFIDDCVKLVNTGFDGIDLDWEYPGPYAGMNFTGSQADFANFENLVQAIRNAIGPNKLITAAFSADPVKLQGFNWSKLNSTMSYFNIMTYDFNGGWSNKAGHNSPIFNYPNSEAPTFNWQSAYNALVSYGAQKSKINMGSPFYGRGVITNGTAALNAPTVKRAETVQPDGPIQTCADFTNWPKDVYDGTPNYFYIKQVALGSGSGWTRGWDDVAKAPYLTKGNFFLSYDDEESIGHKAQFINNNQLAGTIVWTVYGDLELGGSPTQFGKLVRYSSVKSVLVNKINEVFASGNVGIPTVSITAPANNTTVAVGSNVVVNATASDAGGSITKVEFYLDGNKVGEDASSPYSFTITSIAAGSHTIMARATDNSANTATASVSITAGSANIPPTGSITSPANGASFTAGSNITLTASASDSDGTVAKVEFFQGSTKLGEDTSSPYSYTWNAVAAGSYALTVKVTDNGNATATSGTVNITVTASGCTTPAWDASMPYNGNTEVSRGGNKYISKWWTQGEDPLLKSGPDDVWRLLGPCGPSNANPTASIAAPANNATFNAPASITINATASDSDGTIAKVEFFNGTNKLGEDATSPYSFSWANVAAGSYQLTAKATDNTGGTGTSSIVNVTVNTTGNTNPTASITAPANNATFTAPATINITANASDPGGSVTKVEFFNGSTLLSTDTSSPYSFSWTGVAAGSYQLTAKATDNAGGTGTSSIVNVTVSGSNGCSSIPQYVENGGYVAGSIVKNAGNQYECKPFPYTGWCNGASWAYAPGTGTNWQDAWILKGSCTSGARESQSVPPVGIAAAPNFKVVGYMPSWAGTPSDIQYNRMSHINYAFIRPTTTGGLTAVDQPAKLQSIVSQAHANGALVGIAVGGWSDLNNVDFQTMAANSGYRAAFINNLVNLINQYQLDGVDIDWEYPREGNDPANFATLMNELSSAMHSRGKYLTAAVSAQGYYADGVQASVFSAVDFLNLMVYDGDAGAGHSPYSLAVSSLDYWLGRGLPASKAVLGLPFYARPSWKPFRQLVAEGANPNSDIFNGDYYNGIATIKAKTNLAFDRGIAGVMMWELSQDAVGANSLITAIQQVIDVRVGTPQNQAPYGGTIRNIPGTIEAEHYDTGGEGVAYHDLSAGNSGGQLRTDGVDIEATTDTGTGHNVGWVQAGEWLEYSVNVTQAGPLSLQVRVASTSAGKTFHIELDGNNISGTLTVPNTGAWQTWATVTATTTSLTTGQKIMRIVMDAGDFNLNKVIFSTTTNPPPSVSITAPSNGASYTAPATVTINATASDNGSVTKVEFFQGATKLGEDTTSPYAYTWSSVGAGNYTLTAKATDNQGAVTTSSEVNISVTSTTNPPPTVSITAPANGASYTAPASVTISASASDNGSVAKVEFFQGSTKLGEDATSPYSFNWTNVAAGSYNLTARATDNLGATTTSAGVSIVVNSTGGNCSSTPQYVENGGYVAGSIVKNAGGQYECKPYPFTGWCNGAAWAYAPGTGSYWQDAWIFKATCTGGRESTHEIGTFDESGGMTLHPNPGTGGPTRVTLTFDSDPGRVNISMKNSSGADVVNKNFNSVKGNSVEIELPAMAQGLYLIRARGERRVYITKYLVK